MPPLAEFQSRVRDALLMGPLESVAHLVVHDAADDAAGDAAGSGALAPAERLQIHANNVAITLADALAANFPVTAALTGTDFFCRRGGRLCPPPSTPVPQPDRSGRGLSRIHCVIPWRRAAALSRRCRPPRLGLPHRLSRRRGGAGIARIACRRARPSLAGGTVSVAPDPGPAALDLSDRRDLARPSSPRATRLDRRSRCRRGPRYRRQAAGDGGGALGSIWSLCAGGRIGRGRTIGRGLRGGCRP